MTSTFPTPTDHTHDWPAITTADVKTNSMGEVKITGWTTQGHPLYDATIGTVSTAGAPVWVMQGMDGRAFGGTADTFEQALEELLYAAVAVFTEQWHDRMGGAA